MKQLMQLKVTNLKNGLYKWIDAEKYTLEDLQKVFEVYEGAGFRVKIVRNLVPVTLGEKKEELFGKVEKMHDVMKVEVYGFIIKLATVGLYVYMGYEIMKGIK